MLYEVFYIHIIYIVFSIPYSLTTLSVLARADLNVFDGAESAPLGGVGMTELWDLWECSSNTATFFVELIIYEPTKLDSSGRHYRPIR